MQTLDRQLLTSVGTIGITAGASTPNWVIKKVERALDQMPFQGKIGIGRFLYRFQRLLLLTNLYVALAAGCLAYACAKLEGISGNLPFFFLSTFYILSMHTINHLTGQRAQQYNDPERAAFYRDHRSALLWLAAVSAIAGMVVAASIGVWACLVYPAMSVMGLGYNLEILPARFTRGRIRRISDIPASNLWEWEEHDMKDAQTGASGAEPEQLLLQKVSRSFALTIPQLPAGLREKAANAYLLCRIIDTIEDEECLSLEEKQTFFQEFIAVIDGAAPADAFAAGLDPRLCCSTLPAERELVRESAAVVRTFFEFSTEQQSIIRRCLKIMAAGMLHFQEI